MAERESDAPTDLRGAIPEPVTAVARALAGAGHATVLVGGGLRDLLLGRPLRDFDLATAAPPDAVLALFPRAVPIGLRHGTVMVPTAAGPVDVTTFRAEGTLESDLAHRDFTLNAMALDPATGRWLDPHHGRRDLAAGVLRAVGDASERLREDPVRALRAIRFVSELGLRPEPSLVGAVGRAADALRGVAAERLRQELERLLLGSHVGEALRLLRETGLEAALAPGVADDAAALVAATPPDLVARLTAWLRGTAAGKTLARLRFPRRVVKEVEARVSAHPLERQALGLAALRRRRRLLGDEGLDALVALRRAELALAPEGEERSQAAQRLERLADALAGFRARGALDFERTQLAASGDDVMRWLGCGPGPRVGRALRWLTERVAEDPSRNDPETLRALLASWPGASGREEGDAPGR